MPKSALYKLCKLSELGQLHLRTQVNFIEYFCQLRVQPLIAVLRDYMAELLEGASGQFTRQKAYFDLIELIQNICRTLFGAFSGLFRGAAFGFLQGQKRIQRANA